MKIMIEAEPKEIADLVQEIQDRGENDTNKYPYVSNGFIGGQEAKIASEKLDTGHEAKAPFSDGGQCGMAVEVRHGLG